MGFDVYALNPKTDKDSHIYFRANVWYWRPLWSFVEEICEDDLSDFDKEAGHYNDGSKIPNELSIIIGTKLKESLKNGQFDKFREEHEKYKKTVPKDNCLICHRNSLTPNPTCIKCEGTGFTDNIICAYQTDLELTKEFSDFCLNAGGFEIS